MNVCFRVGDRITTPDGYEGIVTHPGATVVGVAYTDDAGVIVKTEFPAAELRHRALPRPKELV